jgi:localization factor PodJL
MSALPAANAASPFTMGPLGDITGSINKPHGAATPAARAPSTALATLTVTPPAGADKLPVAIGGPALRHAAGAGNPAAAYEIGIRFAEGRGVAQNFEEAIRWLDAAARGGVAPAQYRLGSLYEKGQGVKKDREAARKLYVAAAEKGNGKAMHNLAVLYAEGLEGKSDYQMASQWFRKAADHGVSDSQYNLGILYARGIGVEQNLAESYKWFALAAAQGDVDAAKKREDVAARLDQQSLVAARLAVQTWTADPQPDEAVTVKAPPGGWDAANPHPAKPKAAAPVQRKTGA